MATVPSEITWVSGQVVTAAQLNTNLRDAINFLINKPVCEAFQTVAQTLTTGVGAAILMDSESIDNDNGHSTTTNTSRYTVQTAGRFQFSGAVSYTANGTGQREANLWINGTLNTSTKYNATSADTTRAPTRTITRFYNVGDFMETAGYQTSGGNLTTAAANSYEQSTLSVRWVGTA